MPVAVAIHDLRPAIDAGSHAPYGSALSPYGLGIIWRQCDLSAAAGTNAGYDTIGWINLDDISSQAGDGLLNRPRRTPADFHHGDHRGDADDNPEASQQGAHNIA